MQVPSPPQVSVVMAVYNGAPYLQAAIESLLQQTFLGWELVVVDDASTDDSRAILETYGSQDPRIRILHQPQNLGLTRSLNHALARARGDLLARLDGDDIALPARLAAQVNYLTHHPRVGLLMTGVNYIDDRGQSLGVEVPPQDPTVLRWQLLLRNPFCHSTAMWRREVGEGVGGYDPTFTCSQDYDLWIRMAEDWEVHVLPEVLVEMRRHSQSISYQRIQLQEELAARVTQRQLQQLPAFPPLPWDEVLALRTIPRRRNTLQQQTLVALPPPQLARLWDHYWTLWQVFRQHHAPLPPPTALTLQAVFEEDLFSFLQYLRQRRWFLLGGGVLRRYLRTHPTRWQAVAIAILPLLIPTRLQQLVKAWRR